MAGAFRNLGRFLFKPKSVLTGRALDHGALFEFRGLFALALFVGANLYVTYYQFSMQLTSELRTDPALLVMPVAYLMLLYVPFAFVYLSCMFFLDGARDLRRSAYLLLYAGAAFGLLYIGTWIHFLAYRTPFFDALTALQAAVARRLPGGSRLGELHRGADGALLGLADALEVLSIDAVVQHPLSALVFAAHVGAFCYFVYFVYLNTRIVHRLGRIESGGLALAFAALLVQSLTFFA